MAIRITLLLATHKEGVMFLSTYVAVSYTILIQFQDTLFTLIHIDMRERGLRWQKKP